MSTPTIEEPVLAEAVEEEALPHGESCAACGAPFDAHDKFCTACGSSTDDEHSPSIVDAEIVQQKFFRCKNCGSEVATDPGTRSYSCAFCDSTYVVEYAPESGRHRPEFVIGFSVSRDEAQQKFEEWFGQNRWFRPGDLTTAKIEEKLRGVYMPFWSFSMLAQSSWSASIGEHWYRTETYTTMQNGKMVTKTRTVTETEWWNLAGRHHQYHRGYLLSGSRGLPQKEADRIKPFQLPALKRYAPFFLAGWLSEEYSVDRETAEQRCKQFFRQRERSGVASFLPGDKHRDLRVSTTFSQVNSDLIILPVYVLSYRYGDKLFRFMINGQTGKIAGDKPVSRKRIAAAIGSAIGVVLGIIALVLLLQALMH